MKEHKVSVIIFYDDKNRILLQNRKKMSKTGEEWGFFGGHIEKNESPEEAVIRETKEELDFELKNHKFLGFDKKQATKEIFVEHYTFIVPLKNNLSKFNQSEGSGMKLFSLNQAKKLKMVCGDELVLKRVEEFFSSKY